MKKFLVLVLSLAPLLACEPQFMKRSACHQVFDAYCDKAEACTGSKKAECLAAVDADGLCNQEIESSLKDIKSCREDLKSTNCDSIPESCHNLE